MNSSVFWQPSIFTVSQVSALHFAPRGVRLRALNATYWLTLTPLGTLPGADCQVWPGELNWFTQFGNNLWKGAWSSGQSQQVIHSVFPARGESRPWMLEANTWRVVDLWDVIRVLFWATVTFSTPRGTSSHKQVSRPASMNNPFYSCCTFYFVLQSSPSHRQRPLLIPLPLTRMLRLDILALKEKQTDAN